jgi:phage terminase large subunit
MSKLNKSDLKSFQEKIAADPIWFSEHILGSQLWEKEKEILISVRDNYETAVRSCNASGKTYTAARVVHNWLLAYSDAVVITTAPTGRQVREVLWREIRQACAGKDLYPPDAVMQTQINLGSKWFALGLSTDEADKFQGYHSPHLLVVVDEASGVSEETFQAIDGLKPTRILLLGNPLRHTGRFANSFKSLYVAKIHISAFDTPNVQNNEVLIPGLITTEDINRIKERYGEDSDVYRVRVLGEFPMAEEDALIGIDEIAKAMEREVDVKQQFEKKMGVDIARYGNDRTVAVIRHMEKVIKKEMIPGSDLMTTTGQIMRIARDERIIPRNISIDVIGYGAGVVDRLREQGWEVNGVNVAEKAEDFERHGNVRAELYVKIKEWLKTGSLPRDDDFYELTNIKYYFNSKGQMFLESKEDMRSRGLESPDTADALALTFTKSTLFTMPKQSEPVQAYYADKDLPF